MVIDSVTLHDSTVDELLLAIKQLTAQAPQCTVQNALGQPLTALLLRRITLTDHSQVYELEILFHSEV